MSVHIVDANPSTEALGMVAEPPGACVNWDRCGNRVPGAGLICADCLDRVRHGESTTD